MSDHPRPEELAVLRDQLVAQWRRLLERAGVDVGEAHFEPTDIQDKAAREASRRAQLALGDRDRDRLREIDDALHRMRSGTYGTCEETGEPIPLARLKLEPTTRYTVEALELLEDEAQRQRMREDVGDDDSLY